MQSLSVLVPVLGAVSVSVYEACSHFFFVWRPLCNCSLSLAYDRHSGLLCAPDVHTRRNVREWAAYVASCAHFVGDVAWDRLTDLRC